MPRLVRLIALAVALAMVAPGAVAARPPLGQSPAAEPVGSGRVATLDEAVAARIVEPDAVRDLGSRGRVDVFMALNVGPILGRAATEAGDGPGREGRLVEQSKREFGLAKRDLLARHAGGVRLLEDFDHLGLALVRVSSPSALLALLNEPTVASVRVPRVRSASLTQSKLLVNQDDAKAAGYIGTGTSVAVLDTGLDYTRAAFGSCTSPGVPAACRVPYVADFAPADGVRDEPLPACDSGVGCHGTNVSGIVAGVAEGAKVIGLDVFQGSGAADDDIVAALNWVVANRSAYNIRAANLSLGDSTFHTRTCWESLYSAAFASLRSVGVLPVVAAGNEAAYSGTYTNGVSEPACVPGAVSVGAVYDGSLGNVSWSDCQDTSVVADRITCFSQSGPTLSLLAPGALIDAAGITMGGTSQATPHVAAAAAVLAAARPSASAGDLTQALTTTGPAIADARSGVTRRRLDIKAAVDLVRTLPATQRWEVPLSPSYDYSWSYGQSLSRTSGALSIVYTYPTSGSTAVVRYRRSTNSGTTWTGGGGVQLSSSSHWSDYAATAAYGTTVHALWTRFTNPSDAAAARYLYYRRNTNHGSGSWSSIRALTTSGRVDAASIAAYGTMVYVVYTDAATGAVYLVKSADSGATWGPRVSLGTTSRTTPLGRTAAPTVSAYGSYVAVAFLTNGSGAVSARISSNKGTSWTAPVSLSTSSTGGLSVSVVGSRVGFAFTTSSTLRFRMWKAGVWQPLRSVYAVGSTRFYKASRGVSVALIGSSGLGLAVTGCRTADCAGTSASSGVDLIWRESTDDGATWKAPRVIASSQDTDLRRVNDSPDVEWGSSTRRYVAFNGWTNSASGDSEMYVLVGTGPAQ